jgi:hypothetical protein
LFLSAGLLFAIPGARKRDVVEALVMKIGAAEGFGKGFISGSLMNWRAVINVVGPMLFGTVYNWGHRNNYPGFVFLVASLTVVAAEVTLQTLPPSLFEDEEDKRSRSAKGKIINACLISQRDAEQELAQEPGGYSQAQS